MKVDAIQMVSAPELEPNLISARSVLEQAAAQGAGLDVLSEHFCQLGHCDTDKLRIQDEFGDGPIQRFLSAAARELDLHIVGGTLGMLCITRAARGVGFAG